MNDPLEQRLRGIDGPRPLSAEGRARLERVLIDGAHGERWSIDGSRRMPDDVRTRLHAAIVKRRRQPRLLTMSIAASIALLVLASSLVIASERGPGVKRHVTPASQTVASASRPSRPRVMPPGSLRTFSSAAQFLDYVRANADDISQAYLYGVPQSLPASGLMPGMVESAEMPSPAGRDESGAPPAFSQTNVQEQGVDEVDMVKTDGRRLVALANQRLWSVVVGEGGARVMSSAKVREGTRGVLLAGDHVVTFSSRHGAPRAAAEVTHVLTRPWTTIEVLSLADPTRLQLVSRFSIEGEYVDARLTSGVIRLVVQSSQLGPPLPVAAPPPITLEQAKAEVKRTLRRSVVGDWVPHYVVERPGRATRTGHVHDWSAVSRPVKPSGLATLTLVTIDPDDPRPDNALSVLGAGQTVYASRDNLYVTSTAVANGVPLTPSSGIVTSQIHKFDISDRSRAVYAGSGEVPGVVLNQFALSEHEGYLRVATTMMRATGESESRVSVLQEKRGRLAEVGSVQGLGHGERIYSVRFIGDAGYVVTFRQIDPLYVVDLRDPKRPVLRGELKVPGYSAYLHPLSDTLLLGVGSEVDSAGGRSGIQLSLFDVSDPAHPKRTRDRVIGPAGISTVEQDHHAFLYWAPKRMLVIPALLTKTGTSFAGAIAFRVRPDEGFVELARLSHSGRQAPRPMWIVSRSLVIGDNLITLSDAGLLLCDLDGLRDRAWTPWPSPASLGAP